jgi:hypothetical protein
MAEAQENEVGVILSPTEEDDKSKVLVLKALLRHLENKQGYKAYKKVSMRDVVMKGTAITYNGYLRRKRTVDIVTGGPTIDELESKTTEELEEMNDNLKKPQTEKQEIIDVDDIRSLAVPLEEFFIDPDARCLRGDSYEAMDCIWRTIPSLDNCVAELKGSDDPWIIRKNIKKITSIGDAQNQDETSRPLFQSPDDLRGRPSQVQMIRYYNKLTDRYIIVVNDILLRDGPLPYNHKELPFTRHRLIPIPHNFYGIGAAYVLETLQLEDEILRNLRLESIRVSIAPPLVYNTEFAEDIDSQWDMIEPNMKIAMSGPVTPDNVRWLEGPAGNFEMYKMRETLREDAIMAFGINPIAYSVPKAGEPVRNNMMSLESTMKMIKKGIRNWAEEGYVESVRQIIALMRQFYSEKYVSDITTEGKEGEYKKIRLEGIELEDDGTGELMEKVIKGDSYFGVKGEYFNLTGDVDIQIDMDTLVPVSRALKIQNLRDAMTVLMPIFQNPVLVQNTAFVELSRSYIEELGLVNKDKILAAFPDDDSEEEEVHADFQFELIKASLENPTIALDPKNAAELAGQPGESNRHKRRHLDQMNVLMSQILGFNKQIEELQTQAQDPRIQVGMLEEMGQALAALQEERAKIEQQTVALRQHLLQDNMPKDQAVEAKVMESKAALGEPMPGPEGPPPGGPGGGPSPEAGGPPPEGGMAAAGAPPMAGPGPM